MKSQQAAVHLIGCRALTCCITRRLVVRSGRNLRSNTSRPRTLRRSGFAKCPCLASALAQSHALSQPEVRATVKGSGTQRCSLIPRCCLTPFIECKPTLLLNIVFSRCLLYGSTMDSGNLYGRFYRKCTETGKGGVFSFKLMQSQPGGA
jgi:hypothetical protein